MPKRAIKALAIGMGQLKEPMRPLPLTYKKHGYTFHQVKREGNVAIYEQVNPDDGKTVGFEVFEVIQHEEKAAFGKVFEAHEAPPYTEQWGTIAFTSGNLEQANVRFEHIKNLIAKRKPKEKPK